MANQAELIDLAREGKDAWNEHWKYAWSGSYLDYVEPIDLSEAILTEIPSFAGFKFPGEVSFTGATFIGWDDSGEDVFGEESTDSTESVYREATDFTGAVFYRQPHFSQATFKDGADFTGARFLDWAYFDEVKFLSDATFAGVRFSNCATFKGAQFCYAANFTTAKFFDKANFSEAQFSGLANFPGGVFFRKALFNEACFRGEVDFSNRKFKGPTSFRKATFSQSPQFHGSSIYQGTDFGNIDDNFTDFRSDEAERCYRTLKLTMGEQQARTEETAFAALELKSRRHRLKSEAKEKKLGLQRFLAWAERCGYWLWEKFSDSGRSFFRPFALYLASLLGSAALYVLLPIRELQPPLHVLFLQGRDWWLCLRYAFLKQFPFAAAFRGGPNRVSDLETKLFGADLPPGWVDALNATQSITALALIFLMGLGIRHKFRLR